MLQGLDEVDYFDQIRKWAGETETGDRAELTDLARGPFVLAADRRASRNLSWPEVPGLRRVLHHANAPRCDRGRHRNRQSSSLLRRPRVARRGLRIGAAGLQHRDLRRSSRTRRRCRFLLRHKRFELPGRMISFRMRTNSTIKGSRSARGIGKGSCSTLADDRIRSGFRFAEMNPDDDARMTTRTHRSTERLAIAKKQLIAGASVRLAGRSLSAQNSRFVRADQRGQPHCYRNR